MDKPAGEHKIIGRYELEELVGSGGLGEVFRAVNMRTGEVVALKRLHDRYQNSQKLLGLFHKEIMIHSRVSHKHCVRFIEADLTPPNAHIVTDFIDGYNCHNLVRQVGAIPPLITCAILLDMLQGLEHLHCLDIVHSDITPSNIMIEKTGRVLLADFGLSCNNEIEDYAGMTVGTPGYQAPERLQSAPITTLADIYGAGIIFYELLKGDRLFGGLTDEETKKKMQNLKFDWVQTGNKDLDKHLKFILSMALAYKPGRRFQSPRDFMYALYQSLKMFNVRYTRRAIYQWLIDKQLTQAAETNATQKIYVS